MKTWLSLLSLTISISVFGQTSVYHPFPDSNTIWNYNCGFLVPPQGCCAASGRYSFTITGDTTLSGINYHKIFCPAVVCAYGNCGQGVGYLGAFREDILNKKIYYRLPLDSAETILYDFNLNQGDTGYTANLIYRVTIIDSVFVDTDYRKRWNINILGLYGYNEGSIIEGIGSESSLFDLYNHTSPSGFTSSDFISCFVYNNLILFHPDSTASCGIVTGNQDIRKENSLVSLFPNPFHSSVTLQLDFYPEIVELKIYNSIGVQVRRQEILSKTTTINRDGLSNGIYFYRVTGGNGILITGKLIIE